MEDRDTIVRLVRENCGGKTWETVSSAAIRMSSGGMLLVTQSREVHAEVEKLLNELRLYK